MPNPGEGLGHGPGSQKRRKNIKMQVLALWCLVAGFLRNLPGLRKISSCDQVGCQSRDQDPGEPTDDGSACGRRGSAGLPWILVLDFGLPGGCASSRLDHGLKFYENPKSSKVPKWDPGRLR